MMPGDVDVLFADFGVIVQYTPAGSPFSQTVRGLMVPHEHAGFAGQARHRQTQLRLPAAAFAGIKAGESLTVDGSTYRVREQSSNRDAATQTLTLEKIP